MFRKFLALTLSAVFAVAFVSCEDRVENTDNNASTQQATVPMRKPDANGVLLGDANCDGKISEADYSAVVQHLANPDKYGLSELGTKNADVDGVDGITADDAAVIRQFTTGVITEFPAETK